MVVNNDDVDCDELESLNIGVVNDSEKKDDLSSCFFYATNLTIESYI